MMRAGDRDRGREERVSILVVLDWTMMLAGLGRMMGSNTSFNPCCIGLDNDAQLAFALSAKRSTFQSLLYWIGQ